MQEIIENLGRQLGLPDSMVKAGAGAVLQLMQQKAGGGAMQQLFSAIPGTEGLVDAAPPADAGSEAGGGLLGQAAGLLGSLGGGGEAGGGVAGLLGSLSSAGFKPDTAAAFVPALLEQLRGAGGQDALGKIVDQVPELKTLTQGGAGSLLGGLLK